MIYRSLYDKKKTINISNEKFPKIYSLDEIKLYLPEKAIVKIGNFKVCTKPRFMKDKKGYIKIIISIDTVEGMLKTETIVEEQIMFDHWNYYKWQYPF